MALPDPQVELRIDDVWQNITADVRTDPSVVIKRGRRDEASHADPSSATFHLNNRNGRYSPRNPLSDLYGKIGRNTPVRVREGAHNASLVLPGRQEGYAWTPDAPELDITGDIDVRLDCEPVTWRPLPTEDSDFVGLARKYVTTGDQRSWAWWMLQDGRLRFRWSPDGTFTNAIDRTSTVGVPAESGRLAIRVTLDVADGGNHTMRFWTSPTLEADDWTELGSAQTNGGTTSIHAGTADVEVGRTLPLGVDTNPFVGRVYAFELRDGIGGTVVTRRSWEVEESQIAAWDEGIWDTSVWMDEFYEDWELGTLAAVLDESVRFAGEISEWPSRWNLADTDVWVPVQASGILRRLRQGQRPVDSSLFRGITTTPSTVAYWPMEETKDADRFASGLGDGTSGRITQGKAKLADYDELPASKPLPTFPNLTVATFNFPTYSAGIHQRIFFYLDLDGLPDNPSESLFEVQTTGSVVRWVVDLLDTGFIRVRAFNDDSPPVAVLSTGSSTVVAPSGKQILIALWLHQDGADINWSVNTFERGDVVAAFFSGTLSGHTFNRITRLFVGTGTTTAAIGHMSLLNGDAEADVNAALWDLAGEILSAWKGETAAERMERTATEQDLTLRHIGRAENTELMGPAPISTAIEVLEDAASVDLGFFGEDPHRLGLLYRTRHTLYSQDPVLVLDYEAGTVAEPIRPMDDDQGLVNDLTINRATGGAYRLAETSGPMSTQQPPDGVGVYDSRVTLNVANADQLPDQASWRLHLGTVDELRVPELSLILVNVRMGEHWPAISRMIEGDRIRVDNPPAWLPPQPLDLIVQGWTETLAVNWRDIRFVCTPAKPWEVGILEDDVLGRIDTSGSTIRQGSPLSDSTTGFNVNHDPSDPWTTDAAEFPFDVRVNGEIMTVTAISVVAGNVAHFTVTRGTNGVQTEHDGESAVELAYPAIIGL